MMFFEALPFALAILEDGNNLLAWFLLAWPLTILGAIAASILFCFKDTRKVAYNMFGIIFLFICVACLLGAMMGGGR